MGQCFSFLSDEDANSPRRLSELECENLVMRRFIEREHSKERLRALESKARFAFWQRRRPCDGSSLEQVLSLAPATLGVLAYGGMEVHRRLGLAIRLLDAKLGALFFPTCCRYLHCGVECERGAAQGEKCFFAEPYK